MEQPLESEARRQRVLVGLLSFILVILAGWALRETREISAPAGFALFLALLMHPVYDGLRRRLPGKLRWAAILITLSLILLGIAVLVFAVWYSVRRVTSSGQDYGEAITHAWRSVARWASEQGFNMPYDPAESEGLMDRAQSFAKGAVQATWGGMLFLVMTIFLTILILIEDRHWREKAADAWPDRVKGVRHTATTVAVKVREYLLIRTVISAVSGVLVGVYCLLLGVDFPFLWGFLTFLLNYIPNIGSMISTVAPSVMALLQFGVGKALIVAGGIILMEQIIGNFLDPRIQGKRLSISATVILLSVLFWGFVWGIPGVLLAVPMTVILVVVAAHVPALRPLSVLLSRDGDLEGSGGTDGSDSENQLSGG